MEQTVGLSGPTLRYSRIEAAPARAAKAERIGHVCVHHQAPTPATYAFSSALPHERMKTFDLTRPKGAANRSMPPW
jgi:hypothetical protein